MKNVVILETTIGPNAQYKDGVVGRSRPSSDHDKINPNLLSDIQRAAAATATKIGNPNFKVYITTAITGHHPGTRHEIGMGIDIAMMDNENGTPVGWGSIASAKSNKVYNNITTFQDELKNMGYTVNQSDSKKLKKDGGKGEVKNILTFGYEGHNNHIHVSNMDTGRAHEKIKWSEYEKEVQGDDNIDFLNEPTTLPTQNSDYEESEITQDDVDAVNAGTNYKTDISPTTTSQQDEKDEEQQQTPVSKEKEKKGLGQKIKDVFSTKESTNLKGQNLQEEIDRVKDLMKKIL